MYKQNFFEDTIFFIDLKKTKIKKKKLSKNKFIIKMNLVKK